MKKCELLSPAGNMEMLKYAIAYGADAVYLAGNRFGARKFATNFDDEELREAVKYAHLRNVKIYITINTLIYEDEKEDFLNYVKFIHSMGVDAVLVQDFGMMNLLLKTFPKLEIHASTQFHNDSDSTLNLLKSLGVKRAVLDREMSLKEIRKLSKEIEIEVFCHGALCVSYSGQCLFSSEILKRSGNRGECAGLCRLPYKIKDNDSVDKKDAYHLSLKDLCTKDIIYDLLDCGVASLKIEGRMKSPEYVGYITKMYRKLIDSYYNGSRLKLTEEETKNMLILFNRGVTKGFVSGAANADMVNTDSPNHIGIHLGTYAPKREKLELHLEEELHQGDTIRFKEDGKGMTVNFLYDDKDRLINSSASKTTVYVDNFLGVEKSGELRLVGCAKLSKEISQLPNKKIPITADFMAKCDQKIELTVREDDHFVTVEGPKPELAQKRPITVDDVQKQLSKTGDTVYELSNCRVDIENDLFIDLKTLNVLRREALSKLDDARTCPPEIVVKAIAQKRVKTTPVKPKLIVTVSSEEQYSVAKKYTDDIFTSDKKLLIKYPELNPKYVDGHEIPTASKYIAASYGQLPNINSRNIVYGDYMLNATNSLTIDALLDNKVTYVTLSVELKKNRLDTLKDLVDMSKVGILIYGKIELMKMKYDPLEKRGTHLIDRNGSTYRIKKDEHYNYLLSSKPRDEIDDLSAYKKMGFGFYRIDFSDETCEICAKILEKFHKNMCEE